MLAPLHELHEYTGCTQASAVIRRLRALGAPANKNAQGIPAVPLEWWQAFKMGALPVPSPTLATKAVPTYAVNVDAIRRRGRGT